MQCDTSKCLTIQKEQNFTNIRHLPSYFVLKMSDNESFESQTDTEGPSTDSEDIAEQSSVQPYQFEPVADSDYEKQTKTAFFVKLLRRDSKQDVSKYAEHITDEFVGVKFGLCFRTNFIHIFRCSSFAGNVCIDIPST